PIDEMEKQLTPCLRERQVAELVEDREIDSHQTVDGAALMAELRLGFEPVGKVDGVEEARLAGPDDGSRDGDGNVALPHAGSADCACPRGRLRSRVEQPAR